MKRAARTLVLSMFLWAAAALPAAAQFFDYTEIERSGHTLGSFGLGFGILGGDVPFLFAFEADYFIDQHFSIGGLTNFNVESFFMWTLQGVGKYTWDIDANSDFFRQVKPYGQAQMGFAVLDNGDTDTTFLAGFGLGADYFFNSRVALGTNFLFNFGNNIGTENFIFDWQVVTIKYLF